HRRLPPVSLESGGLFIEPEVFEAPAVVDAVDHQAVPLQIGLPAGPGAIVPEDRSSRVFGQLAFDRPHELPALPSGRIPLIAGRPSYRAPDCSTDRNFPPLRR